MYIAAMYAPGSQSLVVPSRETVPSHRINDRDRNVLLRGGSGLNIVRNGGFVLRLDVATYSIVLQELVGRNDLALLRLDEDEDEADAEAETDLVKAKPTQGRRRRSEPERRRHRWGEYPC